MPIWKELRNVTYSIVLYQVSQLLGFLAADFSQCDCFFVELMFLFLQYYIPTRIYDILIAYVFLFAVFDYSNCSCFFLLQMLFQIADALYQCSCFFSQNLLCFNTIDSSHFNYFFHISCFYSTQSLFSLELLFLTEAAFSQHNKYNCFFFHFSIQSLFILDQLFFTTIFFTL